MRGDILSIDETIGTIREMSSIVALVILLGYCFITAE